MSVKPFFLDTNILVYGYSSQDPSKREIAQRLITSGFAVTSVQTLNELCNVLRRKFPGAYANAEQILKELRLYLPVSPLTVETTDMALLLAKRFQWSFYDGLIVSAALDNHCTVILSEDLQHGFQLEQRLKIVNPFLDYDKLV